MARKKKTKKAKKATEATEAVPSEGEPEKEPPKPKKKRARKKADKKKADQTKGGGKKGRKKEKAASPAELAAPPAPAEPSVEPEPEVEPEVEIAADLDAAEELDAQTLVAEVAVLAEAAAGEQAAIPVDEPVAEAIPVEDIDAVLDDEDDDLAALIAQTVAGAEPDDHPAEEPLESLDEGLVEPEPEGVEIAEEAPPADSEAVQAAAPADAGAAQDEDEPEEEIDLTGTIDLGPEITQELRDRLLAQALAHVELQDARYRVPYADPRPAGRWKAVVTVGLLLVAGFFAAAPPAWVRPDPPAQLDAVGRARGLRIALLLQAQQIEAYRLRFQRLPDSLDELPQNVDGLRYVKAGNRSYQLVAYELDGNAIIFDSSGPAPEFARLTESLGVRGTP